MSKQKTLLIVLVGAVAVIGAIFAVRAAGSDPSRILGRADKSFEKQAFDEARLEYLKVLRVDPRNARAIRQLGLIWAEMGAPVQSGLFLNSANKTNPGDPIVMRGLAQAWFSTNQLASARAQALAILELTPTDEEAILMLANTSITGEQLAEVAGRLEAFDSANSAPFHLASAMVSSRKGDLKAAKTSLDTALAIDAESSTVHLALATYYEAVNDRERRLDSLKKASELAPVRSSARLRYARALAGEGKSAEAAAMVRGITEVSRFYLPAWTLLAELTLQTKDTEGSLGMLNEVLGRDPANPEARMLRASVLQAGGKPDEAIKEMEELNRLYPGNGGIKLVLARSYLGNRDPIRAGAALDEVLQLAPDHVEANLLRAQLNIRSGAAMSASDALEKLLQLRPGLPQAEQLLAGAYQAQGRLDEAASVLHQQITKDAGQPGPHVMLGVILRQQGKESEALASFGKAQALAPKDQTIASHLIELDILRKDFLSAHRRAEEQEAQNPGDWSPAFLQGRIYSAQEKWDEAEKALLKALAIQPDSLTVYNLLLDGYMKQGRVPEAISRLEAYLKQKPKSTAQRLILAMLYQQTNNPDQQVAAYQQILADEPDSVTALNNLAYLCAGPLKDPGRARELAARARTLQPDSPVIADTLGWILFQQKDYSQALSLIEEASAKIPDNPEIQYHLGMARYMQGQKEAARSALEKALASQQKFPGLEQAQDYLDQLTGVASTDQGATVESLTTRLKEMPGDVTARLRFAQLQEAGGNFAGAAASYQQALEANAGLVEALTALSKLYAGPLDDPGRATDYARRARALDGRNPAAARALGEAILRQGDFQYAYALLQEASRTTKDDSALTSKLATAAYGIGKTEEARSALQGIVDQAGDSPESAGAKRFLALTGEPAGSAAETAAAALREDPDFLPALMTQAALLQKSGATSEAVGAYERILQQHADFVPAQKQLAALLSGNAQRLDEAQTLAEKARQALPDDPELARTLGMIRYQKGGAEAAVRLLKESDAKSPLDPEGLFYLGMSQLGAGRQEDGIAVLKRALQAGLSETLQQKAEEAIAKAGLAP